MTLFWSLMDILLFFFLSYKIYYIIKLLHFVQMRVTTKNKSERHPFELVTGAMNWCVTWYRIPIFCSFSYTIHYIINSLHFVQMRVTTKYKFEQHLSQLVTGAMKWCV